MSYTIVYKTYQNDLEWFEYSVKSLQKHVLPFNSIEKVLIYTHDICFEKVIKMTNVMKDTNIQVLPVHYNYHGYIKQMIVKAQAYSDVKSEYIVYVDSDCIFTRTCDLSRLLNNDGKPYWHMTDEADAIPIWKEVVEDMTHSEMKYYYMYNSFPFVIKTSTLKIANDHFIKVHKKTYEEYVKERLAHYEISINDNIVNIFFKLSKVFTEFEYIGYIAHNFTNDYEFLLNQRNKEDVKQFWSHGGITDEIKKELDDLQL